MPQPNYGALPQPQPHGGLRGDGWDGSSNTDELGDDPDGSDPDGGRRDPAAAAAPAPKKLASAPRPAFAPSAIRRKRGAPTTAAGSRAKAAGAPAARRAPPQAPARPAVASAPAVRKDDYSKFMDEIAQLGNT